MAILTAGRRGAHRLPRRPVHERIAVWMARPHPELHELVKDFMASVSTWLLPVTIVVVAITTRGAS